EMRLHPSFILVLSVPLFATTYTFTKIVDNTPATSPGQFYMPAGPVLINNQGAVVFHANYRNSKGDTVYGIYTSAGNGIGTIVETDTRNSLATAMNDSGTVVFFEGSGVYSATAGATPFLVLGGPNGNPSFLPASAYPTINNSGTVAVAVMDSTVALAGVAS